MSVSQNLSADPMPAIESILGMPPAPRPVTAETHNVLVDIATQLRIANLIAWEELTGEKNRALIREGLGL